MPQIPVPLVAAAVLMGVAAAPPVVLDAVEQGGPSGVGIAVAAAGGVLAVCGIAALAANLRRRADANMPSGVRLIFIVNILFLAFFTLEFSDLMVRQGGKLIYWTNFLIPPALLLFGGLLMKRRWAWWTARGIAALGVLWFLGFALLIPFGDIQRDGASAPWDVRAFMICLSLGFAGALACACWSIGQQETRRYFGLVPAGGAKPPAD